MLPFKLVYHPNYDLNLGPHVFPSQKFRLIQLMLLREGIAGPEDFALPEEASDVDLLRVHTAEWIGKLRNGTLTASEIMKLEVPYSRELARACWLAAGGSILAGQMALRDGFGCNLGGGFHHAYANHGEGFCAINDVGVAIRRLQADGAIRKAMVVDTDVHHGNGTAAIFGNDPSVFTISIHQENNYPAQKPLDDFRPELLFYVGGADPFCEDQLGGLSLTKNGLKERDRRVFEEARRRGVPVATALAGGYARRVEDTVRIHVNTILAARETAEKFPLKAAAN